MPRNRQGPGPDAAAALQLLPAKSVVVDFETTWHERCDPGEVLTHQVALTLVLGREIVRTWKAQVASPLWYVRGAPVPQKTLVAYEAFSKDAERVRLLRRAFAVLDRWHRQHGVGRMLAYNAPFDRGVMLAEARRVGVDAGGRWWGREGAWGCVLRQARTAKMGHDFTPSTCRLRDVAHACSLDTPRDSVLRVLVARCDRWHSAEQDCRAAAHVHLHLLRRVCPHGAPTCPSSGNRCGARTVGGEPCQNQWGLCWQHALCGCVAPPTPDADTRLVTLRILVLDDGETVLASLLVLS